MKEYRLKLRNGEIKIQKKPDAQPLASFKRNCIIKYGVIDRFTEIKRGDK